MRKKSMLSVIISVYMSAILLVAGLPVTVSAEVQPLKKLTCMNNKDAYLFSFVEKDRLWVNNSYLVDLPSDRIVAEWDNLGSFLGKKQNGDLVFGNDDGIVLTDALLREKASFYVPIGNVQYFDEKHDCLFCADWNEETFFCIDFNGTVTTILRDVFVETYDPELQIAVLSSDKGTRLYSVPEKRFIDFKNLPEYGEYSFIKDRMFVKSWTDEATVLLVYSAEGKLENRYAFDCMNIEFSFVHDRLIVFEENFSGDPEKIWMENEKGKLENRYRFENVRLYDDCPFILYNSSEKTEIIDLLSGQRAELSQSQLYYCAYNGDPEHPCFIVSQLFPSRYYLLDCEALLNSKKTSQESEPFRTLTVFDETKTVCGLFPAGSEQVLVAFSANKGETEITQYCLFSRKQKKALAWLETDLALTFYGSRQNGELVVSSDEGIYLFDSDLKEKKTIAWRASPIFFDPSNDCLYGSEADGLYRMDFNGTKKKVLSFAKGMTVAAFDEQRQLAVVKRIRFADSDMEEVNKFQVFSLSDQTLIFEGADYESAYSFADGQLIRQTYEMREDSMPWEEKNEYTATFFDERGKPVKKLKTGEECRFFENSSYVIAGPDTDRDAMTEGGFAIADLFAGKVSGPSPIDKEDCKRCLESACYLPQENVILFCGRDNRLYEVDCSALSFTQPLPKRSLSAEQSIASYSAGAHLSGVRAEADALEKEFGVHLLLGDEIKNASVFCDYPSTSDYIGDPVKERALLNKAVRCCKETFAEYLSPSFFEHFRDREGRLGLRILFVDNCRISGANVIAFTRYTNNWYNLIFDVHSITREVVMHELWHAVEDLLKNSGNGIDEKQWALLNPAGFDYGLSSSEKSKKYSDYLYVVSSSETARFVYEYSMKSANEDRATLIDALFGAVRGDGAACYEKINRCPYLKAKLDYMAQKVRAQFGEVYWENYYKVPACTAGEHAWSSPVYTWSAEYDFVTARTVCSRCGAVRKSGALSDAIIHENACTQPGTDIYSADFSAPFSKQVKELAQPALGYHTTVLYKEAKKPTLSATGNIACWMCTSCHTYFSDEAGVNQVRPDELSLPKTELGDVDHNGKIEAADARLALRIAVGLEPELGDETDEYAAANVENVDQMVVNAADARLILRKTVGFVDEEFGK